MLVYKVTYVEYCIYYYNNYTKLKVEYLKNISMINSRM